MFLYGTARVSVADAEAIRKRYPALDVETGMRTDTMFLKINPPIIQNDAQLLSAIRRSS